MAEADLRLEETLLRPLAELLVLASESQGQITCHLSSGNHRGRVRALRDVGGEQVVLLELQRDDVLYVRERHIQALTLHEASGLLPQLPAPSSLALKRKVSELAKDYEAQVGAPLRAELMASASELEESFRRSLSEQLEQLAAALLAVAAPEDGRAALASGLEAVCLSPGGDSTRAYWRERCFILEVQERVLSREELVHLLEAGI